MHIFSLIFAAIVLAILALFVFGFARVPNGNRPLFATIRTGFAIAFANEGDPAERVDVVTIETANGPVRINASDYDEATMKLADETAIAAAAAPAGEPVGNSASNPAAPMSVSAEGTGAKRRFFIVNTAGDKLEGEGIAPEGYASDAEAWAAVTAVLAAQQAQG